MEQRSFLVLVVLLTKHYGVYDSGREQEREPEFEIIAMFGFSACGRYRSKLEVWNVKLCIFVVYNECEILI